VSNPKWKGGIEGEKDRKGEGRRQERKTREKE